MNTVTERTIQALNLPKLHAKLPYLSESDAVSMHDYLQSTYASTYSIDSSNIYWGGELNNNHV